MRIAKKIAFISLLFLTVLLSSFLPSNASAVQLGIDVEPNWVQYTFQPYWTYTSSGDVGYKTGYELALGANAGANFVFSVNKVRLQVPANMALNKGGYLVYSFKLDNFQLNDSIDGNFISACVVNQGTLNSSVHVLDVEYQSLASTGYLVNVYLTNNNAIEGSSSVRYFEISSCSGSNELLYLKPAERIIFTEANFYKLKSNTDYSGSINDVKNAINSLNTKLGTTNGKIDDVKNEIKKQSDQQKNQYESEKEEEGQREEDMNGQAEDAQGLFNFNVLNPFSGLFGLFSNSCSVSIPILSSWIHAPSSTYSSWWCANDTMTNIKNTLTPVFGIASMMLLFGFVVRWLSHNSGDIYGARNMNKGLNG